MMTETTSTSVPPARDVERVPRETAPEFDFAALTPAQRKAVDSVAIGFDGTGHAPRVLRRLVEKGFLEEGERSLGGSPPIVVKVYSMPIHVHIRWAEHCSREVDAEEVEP